MKYITLVAAQMALALFAAEKSEANQFNLTRPNYLIELGVEGGPDFVLGIGINMRDPNERIYAPYTPYKGQNTSAAGDVKRLSAVTATSSQLTNFTYAETTEVREEAKYLFTYFRASYGLASFQAALDRTKSDRSSSQSVYVFARKEEGTRILTGKPDWTQYKMESEDIEDRNQRLLQFVSDFGSHYVSSITYGYTLVLRATVNSTENSARNTLSAKLKAGLGKLSAGGALTQEERDYFNQSSINITANVFSGGLKPDKKELILASMEDVGKFLAALQNGSITIETAPVKAVLTSWWARLVPFPKTREAISSVDAKPLPSNYGVPSGTIIGWVPPKDVIDASDPENPKVLEPEGWITCNGSLGSPEIGTSFLRGADNVKFVGVSGGAETHTHAATVGPSTENHNNRLKDGGKDTLPSVNHLHSVTLDMRSNLPPYFQVIWLCRQ